METIQRPAPGRVSIEQAREQARVATIKLSHQDKYARDKAFAESAGTDELDVYLWDLAWGKAKKYYERKYMTNVERERYAAA